MTEAAPVAPATPAPATPPSAAADLTLLPPAHAAIAARAEITRLKGDGDFVKAYLSGNVDAVAKMRGLYAFEANAAAPLQFGGPPPQAQRNTEAASILDAGLPKEVADHYREGRPVSQDEYRLAVAKKQSLFADKSWAAKYFNGDAEAVTQLRLLQVILSSRVAV
jgi:hypothetical protein